MISLLGGIVAIVLGIIGLFVKWVGQAGWLYLLKGLVATVPALLILGGGVAIGATVAHVTPGWSMLIGLAAGMISVVGYTIIQPRLQKATGGVDTCGVHNLHGMTGVLGGLIAVGLVASPLWQMTGVIITVIFAIVMGIIVGFVTSRLGRKDTPYDDKEEFEVSE